METMQVEILEYDGQSGRTQIVWEDMWPEKFLESVSTGDVITLSKASFRVLFRELEFAGTNHARAILRYYVQRFRFISSEELFREMGRGHGKEG